MQIHSSLIPFAPLLLLHYLARFAFSLCLIYCSLFLVFFWYSSNSFKCYCIAIYSWIISFFHLNLYWVIITCFDFLSIPVFSLFLYLAVLVIILLSTDAIPYQNYCTKTIQNVYKNYTKILICIYFVYKDCTNQSFIW